MEKRRKHAPDKSDKFCRRDFPREELQERVGITSEEGIVGTKREVPKWDSLSNCKLV